MVLFGLLFVGLVYASDVLTLTSENFNSVLSGPEAKLIEFYAEWCGHCKKLAPIYEELATAFASSKNVIVAKIDADKEKEIGSRFGIKGFPTLKWFPAGSDQPEDYSGGRDLDALSAFISEKTGAKSKKVKKVFLIIMSCIGTTSFILYPSLISHVHDLGSDFDHHVLESGKNYFVEMYAPWCGHCKKLIPEKVATVFKNEPHCRISKIDATAYPDIATRYGVTGYPTLKFFSSAGGEPETYSGGRDEESLIDYLNEMCGTFRNTDGGILPEGGLEADMNDLVSQFLVERDSRADTIEEAEEKATQLRGNNKRVRYYVNIMDRGEEHVGLEISRLRRLVDGGQSSDEKIDDFLYRINILRVFEGELGYPGNDDNIRDESDL